MFSQKRLKLFDKYNVDKDQHHVTSYPQEN